MIENIDKALHANIPCFPWAKGKRRPIHKVTRRSRRKIVLHTFCLFLTKLLHTAFSQSFLHTFTLITFTFTRLISVHLMHNHKPFKTLALFCTYFGSFPYFLPHFQKLLSHTFMIFPFIYLCIKCTHVFSYTWFTDYSCSYIHNFCTFAIHKSNRSLWNFLHFKT